MTVGLFTTRTMMQAIDVAFKPKTFLKDMFFSDTKTFPTEAVDVDIKKGKRKAAPYVSPRVAGKVMAKEGYKTDSYQPAYLKPKRITKAEDYLNRLPGENLYQPMSSEEKAAQILGQDLADNEDEITRAEEIQAAQALFTGKVIQKGEGVDQEIDFGLPVGNTETLVNTAKWDDMENSDPIDDIRRWRSTVIQVSSINPTHLIFAPDVVPYFLNNPGVQKLLDLRKVEVGQINPQQLPNGATYLGTLTMYGLDIYTYEEWYYDEDSKTEVPMVPAGKVWMGSVNAGFKRLYGAMYDVEDGMVEAERYPRSWVQKDPSARFVETQSRPLCVPSIVDSMFVADVI